MIKRVILRVILFLYFLLMLIFGLYPFEFKSLCFINKISWLVDKNGIQILPCHEVASEEPPTEIFKSFVDAKGFTLEAYLTVDDIEQIGPARIVTYSLDPYQRNFTLGQVNDSLVLRLRTSESDLNGFYPHFRADKVFKSDKKQHITVTYDGELEKLYVDGKLREISSALEGLFSNWDPKAFLVIGNEFTGSRLWQGRLYLVALYNRALDEEEIYQNFNSVSASNQSIREARQEHSGLVRLYTFSEGKGDVVYNRTEEMKSGKLIPRYLRMNFLKKFSLEFNFQHMFSNLNDILLNIFGFVPLSFVVFISTSRHRCPLLNIYLRPILVGIIFSIFLESLQIFTTTRYPAILDIVCNLIGIIIGSIILHLSGWPTRYSCENN